MLNYHGLGVNFSGLSYSQMHIGQLRLCTPPYSSSLSTGRACGRPGCIFIHRSSGLNTLESAAGRAQARIKAVVADRCRSGAR
jgi:hypothetical protein